MNAEEEKAMRERCVFRTFLKESGSQIAPESIESRKPPEPDILCVHESDGKLAFELVEICAEDIARKVSAARKGNEAEFVRSSDPSGGALRKKLEKDYRTEYPVGLLCYTAGRTISPDAVILAAIRPLIETNSRKFYRVWLLGDRCHLVWPFIRYCGAPRRAVNSVSGSLSRPIWSAQSVRPPWNRQTTIDGSA